MRKSILSFAIAATTMLAAVSCAPKAENTATEEQQEVVEEVANTVATETPETCVVKLTDATKYAPGAKVERLTVLDFNAVWCGPCRELAPVLEDVAKKYVGSVDFVSVDVDNYGELMQAYNLGGSIPTVLFIRPDGTTEHYVGTGDLLPASKLEALVEKNLK